jgi:hypothetical protein
MKKVIFTLALALMTLAGVAGSADAAPFGGQKVAKDTVRAFGTDVYKVTYRGGEQAAIAVKGDGSTRLRLAVYDRNGNLLKSIDGTGLLAISWRPFFAATYVIKVTNLGAVGNSYGLATN